MKRKILVASACILALVLASSAQAALITYADRVAWEADVSGITTENFDALEDNLYETLTLGDVTFDVPGSAGPGDLWVSRDGDYTGLGIALVGNYPLTTIDASFSAPVTAVAADVFNLSSDGQVDVTVNDEDGAHVFSLAIDNTNFTFLGFAVDSGVISSVSYTPIDGPWVGIDNFSYGDYGGSGGEVPEPASMTLLGLGIAGMIARVRRRKA